MLRTGSATIGGQSILLLRSKTSSKKTLWDSTHRSFRVAAGSQLPDSCAVGRSRRRTWEFSASMKLSRGSWIAALTTTTTTAVSFLSTSTGCHALQQQQQQRHQHQRQSLSLFSTMDSSSTSKPTSRTQPVPEDSLWKQVPLANSWPRMLSAETPENLKASLQQAGIPTNLPHDNRLKRPVFNGHWVPVRPTGLKEPQMILFNEAFAKEDLKWNETLLQEKDTLLQILSGNQYLEETWATPYALSIMGTRYTSNCPYGTGNGYGDGRAVSIAELETGYELQLKGAGKTPFHRGADGGAVLRSSIREFLASEAMHFLNIPTTRALSLVRSQEDRVSRPWYTPDAVLKIPDIDDIRLAQYPLEQRKQIIKQLRTTQKADPNMMISEPCAITCRVASSFMRIGHIDLFARRAEQASARKAMPTASDKESDTPRYDTTTPEWKELEQIIWHACYREYKKEAYDPFVESNNLAGAAEQLLTLSAQNISYMVANWVRVGFAQGNFNADNCLVGGKTMDYGPFGWMEEFHPVFAKWTGSGQHFGFLNQPSAGFVNYQVLVESVAPVLAAARGLDSAEPVVEEFMTKAQPIFNQALETAIRSKLGLPPDADAAEDLWDTLKELMQESRADWTILFRELTYLMREFQNLNSEDYDDMMTQLEGDASEPHSPFYEALSPELRRQWIAWIKDWRDIVKSTQTDASAVYELMRTSNPKYVLREWMLVDAYSTADDEDYTILEELYGLIKNPYDEGNEAQARNYYRRAPESATARGGTAFMS